MSLDEITINTGEPASECSFDSESEQGSLKNTSSIKATDGGDEPTATCSHQKENKKRKPDKCVLQAQVNFVRSKPPPSLHLLNLKRREPSNKRQ
jgi:hypothetical protein